MDGLISDLHFEIDKHTVICISSPSSFHYLSSRLIAEYFQDVFPNSILVYGGIHASVCPNDFNYQNSPMDYIIIGEGEIPLYHLIEKGIKKQRSPIIIESNPIPRLDELPLIDFSLYEKYVQSIKDLNFNLLSLNLSRGCPFNCAYCIERKIKPLRRGYSPKRAIKEIKQLIDFGIRHNVSPLSLVINDPIFGLNKKWLNDFLSLFNFEVNSVWTECRIDILNEEILAKLQKAQFFLMYGLESCSPDMLKLMNKAVNPNRYLERFKNLFQIHQKFDYLCTINILLNYPGETEKTILESLENFKDIINTTGFSNFTLGQFMYEHFPNTEVYNNFSFYSHKFGSISYFPEWWKDEREICGAYCIKPSKDLSLKKSLKLFLKFSKEIGELRSIKDTFVNFIRIKKFSERVLETMENRNKD